MYWPRLVLTPDEEKYETKYFTPARGRGVLRRFYAGSLEINEDQQAPLWNFQIARRARVLAVTAIGDVDQIRVQFQDASGEFYFVNPILTGQMLGGMAVSALQPDLATYHAPAIYSSGQASYIAPFVFEPNIVLLPNQVLNILGTPVLPYTDTPYRIDLTLHVWEFPNYSARTRKIVK